MKDKKNEEECKLHWYNFSYQGHTPLLGETAVANVYGGYVSRAITRQRIEENKELAELDVDSVLMCCSYLGYMTAEEFKREGP